MKPCVAHVIPITEAADVAVTVQNDGVLAALLAEGRHVECWWAIEGRQPRMVLLLGPPAPERPAVPAPLPWWARGARTVDVLLGSAVLAGAVLAASWGA